MSVPRAFESYLATDGKWYLRLGISEGDHEPDDCYDIGPFNSEKDINSIWAQKRNIANVGSGEVDNSGTQPPPQKQHLNHPDRIKSGNLKFDTWGQ